MLIWKDMSISPPSQSLCNKWVWMYGTDKTIVLCGHFGTNHDPVLTITRLTTEIHTLITILKKKKKKGEIWGLTYIPACLVWSSRWSVGTCSGSLSRTRAARCSGRCPCTPPEWAPASLRPLLDRWRPSCSAHGKNGSSWEGRDNKKKVAVAAAFRRGRTLAFDLTTLLTLSFSATSTAVILAATELLSWLVTGSRLFEMAGEVGKQLTKVDLQKEHHLKESRRSKWEEQRKNRNISHQTAVRVSEKALLALVDPIHFSE